MKAKEMTSDKNFLPKNFHYECFGLKMETHTR